VQTPVGVVLGKPKRPSSKEKNMEDFFGDNENDITNEASWLYQQKRLGAKVSQAQWAN